MLGIVERTGFEGMFGIAELLRLKAEFLYAKIQKGDSSPTLFQQMETTIISAMKKACLKPTQLKAIMTAVKVWKLMNKPENLVVCQSMLKELNQFFDSACVKGVGDVLKARQLYLDLSVGG